MARVNDYINAPPGSGSRIVVPMKAHGALSAGNIVWFACDEDGFETVAVSSSASVQTAACAQSDVASGEIGLFVVQGYVHATNLASGNFTAGNGIETDGGNIEDSGSGVSATGAEANTDFAVSMEAGTTVTELDIFMLGFTYTST